MNNSNLPSKCKADTFRIKHEIMHKAEAINKMSNFNILLALG